MSRKYSEKTTLEQFLEREIQVTEFAEILENAIRPLLPTGAEYRFSFGDGRVTLERGWATGCDLDIKLWHTDDVVDGADFRALGRRVRVEIGWSSTHRSISNALTAVTIYNQMIQLAATLENMIGGDKVYWLIAKK